MESEIVYPDYENSETIYGMSCGIARFFDVKRNCMVDPMEISGRRLVFIFLDGVGWSLYNKIGIPVKGEVRKTKTLFPSTTSTVTTTIFTAQTPGEHGVLGYVMFNKKLGGIINTLKYRYVAEGGNDTIRNHIPYIKAFPIKPWVHETEKRIVSLLPSAISTGEFASTIHKDPSNEEKASIKGYFNGTDMIINLHEILSSGAFDGVFVYYSSIDHLGHLYGYESNLESYIVYDIRCILGKLLQLAQEYRQDTTFILFADHGQVTIERTFILNEDKELLDLLEIPPYGDSRVLWFRTRNDIRAYLQEKYNLWVLSKEEIIGSKLLGKVDSDVAKNMLGDYVGISRDSKTRYIYSYRENDPNLTFKGNHSGLSEKEMYVPLIKIE
ncbi:MAG: alkaline phosphatase family protein [Caldisphaeraceae archaeon]|nr:alkaline phosphatase family protein [Caldisphaeraceae archaeon]MEB3692214.1 alkaline phosphatase family protein [Caldisphaeraceae archaeon]MEB3797656.1 alkaline phosphatase family protein [Caldisphaeraceae archaeon]